MQEATPGDAPKHKNVSESSLPEPRPIHALEWPENIAQVKIDDESSWALLDSGSTINTVTPEFVNACSLDVGPLSELVDGTLKINWLGDCIPDPWAMSSSEFM